MRHLSLEFLDFVNYKMVVTKRELFFSLIHVRVELDLEVFLFFSFLIGLVLVIV